MGDDRLSRWKLDKPLEIQVSAAAVTAGMARARGDAERLKISPATGQIASVKTMPQAPETTREREGNAKELAMGNGLKLMLRWPLRKVG